MGSKGVVKPIKLALETFSLSPFIHQTIYSQPFIFPTLTPIYHEDFFDHDFFDDGHRSGAPDHRTHCKFVNTSFCLKITLLTPLVSYLIGCMILRKFKLSQLYFQTDVVFRVL